MSCKKEKIFDLMFDTSFEGGSWGSHLDEKFSNVIFLTFRNFATANEFLTHLIMTYYVRLSETPTDQERESFEKKRLPTQLKVLKVLHQWIEHHWHDFGLHTELRVVLDAFLNHLINDMNSEHIEVARGLLIIADIEVCLS
jgi:hypothetical protein